jgi:hemerythrin-like domain-containing protein
MNSNYIKAMSEAYATYMARDKSASKDIMQNAHGYISLLKNHIEKENTVLFMMAESRLSEKIEDLFEKFERIEEERIGLGKHEEFHNLLKELGGTYLS